MRDIDAQTLRTKIILEAFRELRSESRVIVSASAVRKRVDDNIYTNAYDSIYGLKPKTYTEEDVASVLSANNIFFRHEGTTHNQTQIKLIDLEVKKGDETIGN